MNYFVVTVNLLSAVALQIAIIIVLARAYKTKSLPNLLLGFALSLLFFTAIINILEYTQISEQAEDYEDIISVLFLPILIFSIHTSIINKELQSRKKSESKFKGIFNQSFSFIGLLNPKGEMLEINSTAANFVDNKDFNFIGKPFHESKWWNHSKEERDKVINAIEKAQKGEIVRFETTHYDANKELHYIDFSIKPAFDENQNVIYLIPEGRDITEIKLARIELENHKNNLEQLVRERTDELLTANEEITAINEELYDKNRAIELTNKDLKESKEHLELTLKRLKETQSHLIESEKMASIGVLSAGIAHEINNPINFINSNLTGLKKIIERFEKILTAYNLALNSDEYKALNKEFQDIDKNYKKKENKEALDTVIHHIQTGVNRTVEIVDSLKYFLHSDESHKLPVNIHDIIKSVLVILHNEYKNHIVIKENYKLNEDVKCFAGKMNQVIMNILSNAIQAINDTGEITISTYKEEDNAIISIANNGEKIPDDIINKIFDPFFSTKTVGQGVGLGLYLSYNIIKEQNGQLSVNSTDSVTEFRISLPHE